MNINSGKSWSEADLFDLRNSLSCGRSIREVADFLCRDFAEVQKKAAELGLVAKRPRDELDQRRGPKAKQPPGQSMTMGNMREQGVHHLIAFCGAQPRGKARLSNSS
jgi:hypothetical protein